MMNKKAIIGSYEHDKMLHPHRRKQYQKSRNKKARKRYYKSVWKRWWSTVDWDIFWAFIEPGC